MRSSDNSPTDYASPEQKFRKSVMVAGSYLVAALWNKAHVLRSPVPPMKNGDLTWCRTATTGPRTDLQREPQKPSRALVRGRGVTSVDVGNVLVGNDAKVFTIIERVMPVSYWTVLDRLIKARA